MNINLNKNKKILLLTFAAFVVVLVAILATVFRNYLYTATTVKLPSGSTLKPQSPGTILILRKDVETPKGKVIYQTPEYPVYVYNQNGDIEQVTKFGPFYSDSSSSTSERQNIAANLINANNNSSGVIDADTGKTLQSDSGNASINAMLAQRKTGDLDSVILPPGAAKIFTDKTKDPKLQQALDKAKQSATQQTAQQPTGEKCVHIKPGEDKGEKGDRIVFPDEKAPPVGGKTADYKTHKDIEGKVVVQGNLIESESNYQARNFDDGSGKKGLGILNQDSWPKYEDKDHVGQVKGSDDAGGKKETNYETFLRSAGGEGNLSKIRWTSGNLNKGLGEEQLTEFITNKAKGYHPANSPKEAVVQAGVFNMNNGVGSVCSTFDKKFWKIVAVNTTECKFEEPKDNDLKDTKGNPTALGRDKATCDQQAASQGNEPKPEKDGKDTKTAPPTKNPPTTQPPTAIPNPNQPQPGQQPNPQPAQPGGSQPGGGGQQPQQQQYQTPTPYGYTPTPTPYEYTPTPYQYYTTPTPYVCLGEKTAVCLKSGITACVTAEDIIVASPTPSASPETSASPSASAEASPSATPTATPTATPSPTPAGSIDIEDIDYFGACVDWGTAGKTDMMNQIASLITKSLRSESGLFSNIDQLPTAVLNAITKAISTIIGQLFNRGA